MEVELQPHILFNPALGVVRRRKSTGYPRSMTLILTCAPRLVGMRWKKISAPPGIEREVSSNKIKLLRNNPYNALHTV